LKQQFNRYNVQNEDDRPDDWTEDLVEEYEYLMNEARKEAKALDDKVKEVQKLKQELDDKE